MNYPRLCKLLIICIIPISCAEEPELAPSPPTNLTATVISSQQIDLEWTDNSTNETGFKIERKTAVDDYTVVATAGQNVTTYNDDDLVENTAYTYRAYAFSAAHPTGSFSNEASATTLENLTITDFDGNTYPAVKIGAQTWMAENLKTTKLNDGTPIALVTDDGEWSTTSAPAYSYYDNNKATFGDVYGGLYNWYTIETGKLCPTDWHVATDDDWTELTVFLGGADIAGGKLKEGGVEHWTSPNTDATNEVGFTALPGGYHNSNGSFNLITEVGRWWSATEVDFQIAKYQAIGSASATINSTENLKKSGFAIRCVKD